MYVDVINQNRHLSPFNAYPLYCGTRAEYCFTLYDVIDYRSNRTLRSGDIVEIIKRQNHFKNDRETPEKETTVIVCESKHGNRHGFTGGVVLRWVRMVGVSVSSGF